jgi:hypothetical protein
MQMRLSVLIFLLGTSSAIAQTAPPANRDFSGIWGAKQAANVPWAPNTNRTFAARIQLKPEALEHCRHVGCVRGVRFTNEAGGNAYLIGEDPALRRCAPYGFPRVLLSANPLEIFHSKDRVFMLFYRNNELREIWVDGRSHPESLDLSWMGHSIGRWDGDTLVTDVRGIIGGELGKFKWLDEGGWPHSDDLHITERIRRTSREELRFDMNFEDPGAWTAPFQTTVLMELNPNSEEGRVQSIKEYVRCEDRIFADSQSEFWPFFQGEEYPLPDVPPVGPEF